MGLLLPRVIQRPTPNYTPTPIRHDLFIYHDEEGEADPSLAWLCDPRAKAAPHLAMGTDSSNELSQLVPLQYKAWAQCAFNSAGISLEIPGYADKLPDTRLQLAATIGAWVCRAYNIPPVLAPGGLGRGIVSHRHLGRAGGGHMDVGDPNGSTWATLVKYTQGAYEDIGKLASLPAFALYGLPAPHEVVAAPDVTPAPSHGGAPRCEPGDTHAHPTPSGFTQHSVAALQADLNKLTNAGLLVDGRFGELTTAALKRFQAAHGCDIDGQIGPESWTAIDAAMASA
jgi:hypothetical protein